MQLAADSELLPGQRQTSTHHVRGVPEYVFTRYAVRETGVNGRTLISFQIHLQHCVVDEYRTCLVFMVDPGLGIVLGDLWCYVDGERLLIALRADNGDRSND